MHERGVIVGTFANEIAPRLSSNTMHAVRATGLTLCNSINKQCKGINYLIHAERATYSAFSVDTATSVCNFNFQTNREPPSLIKYPVLDISRNGKMVL